VVGQDAEVPDADKTFGQDVKEKAAYEFVRGNGHDSRLVAACIVPPTKRDVATIEGNEPVVGDGDTVSVASEVTDHLLRAAEGGLAIDDPVLAKQRSEKRREALWLFKVLDRSCANQLFLPISAPQASDKLSPEDLAERLNGQEEGIQRMDPSLFVRRDSAAWNNTVNVGMEQQVLSPCVKDPEETNLGSQMFGVACHFTERFGNRAE
jgi:hypothetical protein